jgi:hypothetical protein
MDRSGAPAFPRKTTGYPSPTARWLSVRDPWWADRARRGCRTVRFGPPGSNSDGSLALLPVVLALSRAGRSVAMATLMDRSGAGSIRGCKSAAGPEEPRPTDVLLPRRKCISRAWLGSSGHPGDMTEDDAERVRGLMSEASALLGQGQPLLQIVSLPAAEWVFVGVEGESVVVSDNGETFGSISGFCGPSGYLQWSDTKATSAALRFGVELLDESGDGYRAVRLGRTVGQGQSVAEVVQAVAMAIDGTFALHTPPDSPTYNSYFWDKHDQD